MSILVCFKDENRIMNIIHVEESSSSQYVVRNIPTINGDNLATRREFLRFLNCYLTRCQKYCVHPGRTPKQYLIAANAIPWLEDSLDVALHQGDKIARRNVCGRLGELGTKRAKELLKKTLSDSSPTVRASVQASLKRIKKHEQQKALQESLEPQYEIQLRSPTKNLSQMKP